MIHASVILALIIVSEILALLALWRFRTSDPLVGLSLVALGLALLLQMVWH